MSKNILLVPFVNFNDEPDYYSNFDLFISSSKYTEGVAKRSETFGMSTLEAIASGLPVIVTDAGGSPEVVGNNNIFSKVVPHNNGLAIGKAIESMVNEDICFSNNIKYAKDRLSIFSKEKQMKQFENLINEFDKKLISVALFSTNIHGGAGYAAFRLHKSLLNNKVSSKIFIKNNSQNFYGIEIVNNIFDNVPLRQQVEEIFVPNHTMFTINELSNNNMELLKKLRILI